MEVGHYSVGDWWESFAARRFRGAWGWCKVGRKGCWRCLWGCGSGSPSLTLGRKGSLPPRMRLTFFTNQGSWVRQKNAMQSPSKIMGARCERRGPRGVAAVIRRAIWVRLGTRPAVRFRPPFALTLCPLPRLLHNSSWLRLHKQSRMYPPPALPSTVSTSTPAPAQPAPTTIFDTHRLHERLPLPPPTPRISPTPTPPPAPALAAARGTALRTRWARPPG